MTLQIRLTLVLICATIISISAQTNTWTDIAPSQITAAKSATSNIQVRDYRSLSLDFQAFQEQLAPIVEEELKEGIIALPMPDGAMSSFKIKNSPLLESALATKYPSIQTFHIQSIETPTITGRMNYTPMGVHAIVLHPEGAIFIEPQYERNTKYYASYYAKEDQSVIDARYKNASLGCGSSVPTDLTDRFKKEEIGTSRSKNAAVDMTVYRLALSCTGEFVDFHRLREKGEVLFEFVNLVTFINAVFERDFAIQFQLINEVEDLVFLDKATDPFEGDGSVISIAEQSSFAIETRVNVNSFDIGHVLTSSCFTGGGVVGVVFGLACGVEKSQGVSCQFQSNSVFATNVFAHELAHQFSGSHTWSNCPGSEGQRAATPYEPGSGSTIMSYAGACGAFNNIQSDSDPYFHVATIEEIENFQIANSTCGIKETTSNVAPVAIIERASGFTIPINTPFELEGIGMDEDGDALTYAWEQYDLGPAGDLRSPRLNAPTFRSYPPMDNPVRTFPRLETVISNIADDKEFLSTYSRDFTFRFTVRDNHPEGGGVDWKDIQFKATDQAGPFTLTFPNKGIDAVNVGDAVNITWEVANTNQVPVNCQKVNILLSIDGGFTYPIVLASEVENDGRQTVTIPDLITTTARVKIEAADNIFFDISNNNFDIRNPSEAGFSFATSIQRQQICLPEQAAIDLNTVSLLGYASDINFTVSGLPDGVGASFQNNIVQPGNTTQVILDFADNAQEGEYEIMIQGTAPNAATISRTIEFELVSNNFSDLQLLRPTNNSVGVKLPAYAWTESEDADVYVIEIATAPNFGNSIIERVNNLRAPTYQPSVTLIPNTIYYWRVIPINDCGERLPSETFAFQTESFSCTTHNSTQVPILISSQGTPTITSTIDIIQDFSISDLNVATLKGSHDWVSHIQARLVSPQGTTVTLMSGKCPGAVPFDLGLDDEATSDIPCPPNDGLPHLPQASLSDFDGENAAGAWTLEVEVLDGFGAGGSLEAWGLEFCSNISLAPPVLVVNNALSVQPAKGRTIEVEFLAAQDPNNSASEIIYTLIAIPQFGQIFLNNNPLEIGSTFTQADLDNNLIRYKNELSTVAADQFTFTVSDGEGGWVGITPFDIVLDVTETITDTEDILIGTDIQLFPNPATDIINLELPNIAATVKWSMYNVGGQLVGSNEVNNTASFTISTAHLSEGLYFVMLDLEEGRVVKKVVVD